MAEKFLYGLLIKEGHEENIIVRNFYKSMFLYPVIDVATVTQHHSRLLKGEMNFSEIMEITYRLEQENTKADFEESAHLASLVDVENAKHERNLKYTNRLAKWILLFEATTKEEIEYYFSSFSLPQSMLSDVLLGVELRKIKRPEEIKAKLDSIVIGQDNAKKVLSFAFYLHLLRCGLIKPEIHRKNDFVENTFFHPMPRPSILLVGNTGSGKTYLLKNLCEMFGVPFIKVDCSSLTSSGYVGNGVDTYLQMLVKKYGERRAQHAVVFFDEFDKISENQTGGRGSVGGVELQQEFLTFLEDKEKVVSGGGSRSVATDFVLPTGNIMFVFSGSFAGIEKIIFRRLHKTSYEDRLAEKKKRRKELIDKWKVALNNKKEKISKHRPAVGFNTAPTAADAASSSTDDAMVMALMNEMEESKIEEYFDSIDKKYLEEVLKEEAEKMDAAGLLESISYEDVIKFGIIPELAGRIGFIAVLKKLAREDIISIIKSSEGGVLEQFRNYFNFHADTLVIKEEVYGLIAEEVLKRNIGARAINGVLLTLLQDLVYEAPNMNMEEFLIDEDYFKKRFP